MTAGYLYAGRRWVTAAAALLTFAALVVMLGFARDASTVSPGGDAAAETQLGFVPNRGQFDARARFALHGPGFAAFVTRRGVVVDLERGERSLALRLTPVGANPNARIVGDRRASGRVSYFTGRASAADLPTYSSVAYRDLWPGIDLVVRSGAGALKYEFRVAPGADPSDIRLAWTGADSLSVLGGGTLGVKTDLGTLRDRAPRSWQPAAGAVASRYVVDGRTYGFSVGRYDASRPLVIDPSLLYSTFLGGAHVEEAVGVAVDGSGNAYITGATNSADFPTTVGAYDSSLDGGDAYITKLSASGALVYSTFIGGGAVADPFECSPGESTRGIAVDGSGNAYIHGTTGSIDFPVTPGAFATSPSASSSASCYMGFVTKLNASGASLGYSTYLGEGGSNISFYGGIAVDPNGGAYVTSWTNMPSTYPITPGAFDPTPTPGGSFEIYVTKLNPSGSALDYSTFLGQGFANGIDVDAQGNAYVVGRSTGDQATTPGAFDPTYNAGADVFVSKLNPTGTALAYGTYLGGSGADDGKAIDVDAAGSAYVFGRSDSGYPTTPGAYATTPNGNGVVTKLSPDGASLVYSTYIEGDYFLGQRRGMAVDQNGGAYLVAETRTAALNPTPNAADSTFNGGATDVALIRLNPAGSNVQYESYIGGSNTDNPDDVAVDAQGVAHVVGDTISADYPVTPTAIDTSLSGGNDGFYTKTLVGSLIGYPRPKSASPLYFSLTPAYLACTPGEGTRVHAPPLSHPSCAPPEPASSYLTVGTPDSNGQPANSTGSVKLTALNESLPLNPNNGDQSDIAIQTSITDVRIKAGLTDYTGELRFKWPFRITDHDNGGGEETSATVQDLSFAFTVPCSLTASSSIGSTCSLNTTYESIYPGTVKELQRAIWAFDPIQVLDGGADGNAATSADNTLFAVQGIFVP